jgi:hypothetical protein
LPKKGDEMTTETEVSTEEAREVLAQELAERAQECAERVQEVLAEFDCNVDIAITINGRGQVNPHFNIIANPR